MTAAADRGPVLVTGVTGFIAQHVVVALLARGYRVRGTVRNVEYAKTILEQVANRSDPNLATVIRTLPLTACDLERDDGWSEAVAGCNAVIHVASPLPLAQPRDPEVLIRPAREGTLRVLRAASAHGVRRVVMTSSVVAAIGTKGAGPFDASHWSDPNDPDLDPYGQSKTVAERAAWSFVTDSAPSLELTTILPGLVLGPLLSREASVSCEAVRQLLTRSIPGVPDLRYPTVDVRDVAEAHVAALVAPRAPGQRYLCASDGVAMRATALVLAERYNPRGFRVPTRPLPDVAMKLVGLVRRELRFVAKEVGRSIALDRTPLHRDLLATQRPLEESVVATAESMIELGVVTTPHS